MNHCRLQVDLDISQKRLDVCAMLPDGEMVTSHQSFANNRRGYEGLSARH